MSFEVQIMSKDNSLSISLHQMEAIVFIILQILFATHTGLKLGNIQLCEAFKLWPGTLHCVLGHDTSLSQCLSPPRCING